MLLISVGFVPRSNDHFEHGSSESITYGRVPDIAIYITSVTSRIFILRSSFTSFNELDFINYWEEVLLFK